MNEETLFAEALEKHGEARAAFLGEHCKHDIEMKKRLEALLRANDNPDPFLDPCAPMVGALTERPTAECPGTVIGPYKLLEQIGEGGFGVVFMAEQAQPIQRKVALKVLKPGMDTRQVVARFEAERQALALMQHPNIAQIFDGGETVSGRPYFVMELVRGISITDFCDQNHLSIRERLDLFISVCQAVQHAHQKGIIHRDLKPSNVLVTMHDGAPLAKVIDFGIAKATGRQLTEKTLFTNFAQLIGTPMYMSPEQAQMSATDVDTRSDIYSLGVLLYELLTGTTPFDKERLRTAAFDEIRRMIREEEPARPSTRLSTLGHAVDTISANRHCCPKRLSQICRGELDWIVMKSLDKDRNRRYETAHALAMDLQRYLADEPVQACPPSAWYRIRKFARRNKAAFMTGAAASLAVVVAVVGLTISNYRISHEKTQKEVALAEAEANLLLARQAVDEIYTPVAQQLSHVPHMQPFQRHVLVKARDFYQELAKRKSSDPAIRLESAHAGLQVIQIQYSLGQYRQHEEACRALVRSLQELEREPSLGPKRRQYLGETLTFLASILAAKGRREDALQTQRQAVALYRELVAECPEMPGYRRGLITALDAMGSLQHDRPDEAEQLIGEAIGQCEELVKRWPDDPNNHAVLVYSHYMMGYTLNSMNRLTQAEDAFRRAIAAIEKAPSKIDRTGSRNQLPFIHHELGKVLARLGRVDEAETALRRAIFLGDTLVGQFPDVTPYRQSLVNFHFQLARVLAQAGRPDEAAKFGSTAVALSEKLTAEFADEEQPKAKAVRNLMNWGCNLRDADELQGAEQALRKALAMAKALAEESPSEGVHQYSVAEIHGGLAVVFERARRYEEAVAAYRDYLAICEKLAANFPDDPDYRLHHASAGNFLGVALRRLPRDAESALPLHRNSIKLCERLVGQFPDRLRYAEELVRSHYALGLALLITGNATEAESAFRRAIAVSDPAMDRLRDPPVAPSVHNDLARLLATSPDEQRRNPKAAVELARTAVQRDPRAAYLNTLGVAEYRVGNWKESLAALEKSMGLKNGGDSFDWYFLAMARWQLGAKEKACAEYDRAVKWMEKHRPMNDELRRFRAETAELLDIKIGS